VRLTFRDRGRLAWVAWGGCRERDCWANAGRCVRVGAPVEVSGWLRLEWLSDRFHSLGLSSPEYDLVYIVPNSRRAHLALLVTGAAPVSTGVHVVEKRLMMFLMCSNLAGARLVHKTVPRLPASADRRTSTRDTACHIASFMTYLRSIRFPTRSPVGRRNADRQYWPFQTGQPFTVNSIFDVNLDGNLTDRLDTTTGLLVTGKPATTTDRNGHESEVFARHHRPGRPCRPNTFSRRKPVGPDLSLARNFAFAAQRKLTLRMDVFTSFNRAIRHPRSLSRGRGFWSSNRYSDARPACPASA